jgi:hypothetical protein
MLIDTLPMRLAFWTRRPLRPDAIPDLRDAEPVPPSFQQPSLRPAADLETRLMLRDRGWNP